MNLDTEFESFWNCYPRREGKLDARKAYEKARKLATADAILAGVQLYVRHCSPERRYQKMPGTWLRAGCWMDELPGVRQVDEEDWRAECLRLHDGECGLSRWRHHERKETDAIKQAMRK